MKRINLLVLMVVTCCVITQGQTYSLKQCISYAFVNNSTIKIEQYEDRIAEKKVMEQIGTALPQLSVSGSADDNLNVATQLMPGALFGQASGTFVPIKTGTKYSLSTEAKLEQKLYDATFWTALKAAKITKEQSRLNLVKAKEETGYSVCLAYYKAMVIKKKCAVLKSIVDAAGQTLKTTDVKYRNGAAKKIDVDKIRVTYNNNNSEFQQMELSYKQALNSLRYAMGMPVDSVVAPADTIRFPGPIDSVAAGKYTIENRTDYQIKKVTLKLQEADKKAKFAAYFPTLSFNADYAYKTMPNTLTLSDTWYESSSIGLSLSFPLFDGVQKHSRLAQTNYAIEEAKENIIYTEKSIKVDISNY